MGRYFRIWTTRRENRDGEKVHSISFRLWHFVAYVTKTHIEDEYSAPGIEFGVVYNPYNPELGI